MTVEECQEVIGCYFANFSTTTNGGVICINSNKQLFVCESLFNTCRVASNKNGGCIYFSSTRQLTIKCICSYNCNAYYGFCLYSTNPSQSGTPCTIVNQTVVNSCSGSYFAFVMYYSNFITDDYNSSFCYGERGNVFGHNNKKSYSIYHNYYHNDLSVLYGVNGELSEHLLSHSVFVENDKGDNQYGLIHINEFANEELIIDNMYAYGNKIALLNPLM